MITFLLINNSTSKEKKYEISPSASSEIKAENEKKLKEIEEIQTILYQEDGFFEQVNNKLKERGYAFQVGVAVYSKDDIRVKYILINKDAVEPAQKEIKSIFYEAVKKNDLDPDSFHLKVGDSDDGPDW
ncbi:hypothetical protein [Pseudobacillus wudalianchiensis]|uniref:Uncharacterized protein n=1 Tax=Pseudobacillus wudalianchiensis TaxID=1743143 RepID=A0A1B9B936_9BACI|nr:hypothetical protein [Bacillus wudalianchiensis]OCA92597.1 hypothetical protein A8F95_02560 [Bacillus wudalianchiensis]